MKIAIIETKPSKNDYYSLFDGELEDLEILQLCSDPSIKKVLKKDIDLDIDVSDYDWIILVGSDALKYYTGLTSITQYTGSIQDNKFLPVINPAMLLFNPSAEKTWTDSKNKVLGYIKGDIKQINFKDHVEGIEETERANEVFREILNSESRYVALDSETSSLYPRDGYILGVSLSYNRDFGYYISADCIDEEGESLLQEIFNNKIVVFHNAKFDIKFFRYHFGFEFPRFHDTMLMHYVLDETRGTHGLKYLAIQMTKYGDYEKELEEWKTEYCRKNKIKKEDFSYAFIPFNVMYTYAAMDAVVTLELLHKFISALSKNKKLKKVYNKIMLEGCDFLIDVEDTGIPLNESRLISAEKLMEEIIAEATEKLYSFEEVKRFEEQNKDSLAGGKFNPNSVVQLRKLFFDYLNLEPSGIKTDKKEHSTNEESLKFLAKQHPVPDLILSIRKKGKIKNTYLAKLIPELDRDGRVRTNFNQHMTTSGRLSSSGKFNAQQLIRDDPIVKGCIEAKEGNLLVAMDLTTAEMYYATAYSKDEVLSEIFRSGENLHSSVAKEIFDLPCAVDEVAELYSKERQATKAINFGIIYGAGGYTISASIKKDTGIFISPEECNEYIRAYFNRFKALKQWLDDTSAFISANAFIYSHFGRKRRLPDVRSSNKATRAHEIRSGLNFMIQSVASDINVLAGIDMNNYIKTSGMDAKIFMLVHDSIVAEVAEDQVDDYRNKLQFFVQKDRGISIPGSPIGCDFDIGHDYSFGKFSEKYPEIA